MVKTIRKLSDMNPVQQSAVRQYYTWIVHKFPRICQKCGVYHGLLAVYKDPRIISVERHDLMVVCRDCFSKQMIPDGKRGGKKNTPVDDATKEHIVQQYRDGVPITVIMKETGHGRRVINRIISEEL